MKRLESNVTSNSAIDRITRLKNKALGLVNPCNIVKNEDYELKYTKKSKDLRTFKNSNNSLTASEKIKQIKSNCVNETKLKKIILNKMVNIKILTSDKYGRLLAEIIYDNKSINDWLLSNHLAINYNGETKKKIDWEKYAREVNYCKFENFTHINM